MVLTDILEEHLEEADFLWHQRERALMDRVYDLDDLAELEERLLAHLDGLVLGQKEVWKLLEPKLAEGELGEVFAATFVALESGGPVRIDLVQRTFPEAEGAIFEGIRHALRHASSPAIEKIVRPCLNHERGVARAAAIEVASFRRLPLDLSLLQARLNDKDPLVAAAAANAVGRLRIAELKNEVESVLENESPEARFEAMRTGFLLRSEKALNRCRQAVKEKREEAGEAIILLGLAGQNEDGLRLVNALEEASLVRNAITSLGFLGCVAAMDPLIQCAADPKLARLAGQAIQTLTGVDLEKEKLLAPKTEPSEINAAEEDGFKEDPDERLPFPDSEKLQNWWRKNASRFGKKERYRKGLKYTPQGLIEILRTGTLAERHAAALELALIDPSRPFLETNAFAIRQRREMEVSNPQEKQEIPISTFIKIMS